MKIVHVNIAPYPSYEASAVQAMKVCESFADLGHEVTMIVPCTSRPVSSEEIFTYYGTKANFRIEQLRCSPLTARSSVSIPF